MKTSASEDAPFFTIINVVLYAVLSLSGALALAQAAAADYTADLPSVARVEATIKSSDPTDTLARQVAVFNYLLAYIDRTKYARTVRGPYTVGEQKMMAAYAAAGYQISQDFAKSHAPAEVTAFNQLHGRYEMDEAFNAAWQKQLIGPQAAAAYAGAVNSLAAGQQAHITQEQQQYQRDTAAQQATASGMSSDPTSVAARRCLELGGSNSACLGSSLLGGIVSTFTGGTGLGELTETRSGIVLNGTYGQSATVPDISFYGDSATIGNCGKLVADGHGYTLLKTAGSLKVNVANDPSPIVLTMRSDGSLAGPGIVTVSGRIITGYHTVTATQMINGARAVPNQCSGPCQTVSQVPDYAPATAKCTLGVLAAPPPAAQPSSSGSDSSSLGGLFGAIAGMVSTVAPVSTLPGLRMEGKYASSSGLLLDFTGDTVTIDCGQAHVKAPYTVVNKPSTLTINVQNSGSPFTLTVASDNTLSGLGSATVNGRLVSGMNGDTVTFTPHSETCAVATFTPQSASSSSLFAPNPSAASVTAATPKSGSVATSSTPPASSAGMKISVTSTFPTATNPLSGKPIKLMTDRFDNALRSIGAPIPASATPGQALQAWAQACRPPADCTAPAKLMAKYYVGSGTFDTTGKVALAAPAAPGTYYVFCSLAGTKGVLVWDMPITLKPGDNTIDLTATNAELVPTQ